MNIIAYEISSQDARASFRQTLSESTQKLDVLAKKLGSSVEKARPYYDARVKARDVRNTMKVNLDNNFVMINLLCN